MKIPAQFDLNSYSYELPEDRIAQHPSVVRTESKLMVLDRGKQTIEIESFSKFPQLLPDDAVLVVNNSKVFPARMLGKRPSGGKVELLLLTPLSLLKVSAAKDGQWMSANIQGLLKASKSPKHGELLDFGPDMKVEIGAKQDFGKFTGVVHFKGSMEKIAAEIGHVPLPPYIKREDAEEDRNRYQTVYSNNDKVGSVAAPTAGLHFSSEMMTAIRESGIKWAEVTLYVGYGTFSPIRVQDIREHRMHEEYVEISAESAAIINQAKADGRPVVAVGTTSVRTLEGVYAAIGGIQEFSGWTDIYIKPGYDLKVVDKMLTNFHLPKSSLLVMVSAIAGREFILSAYHKALANDFRFFSYGDAMFIR